MGREVQGDVGSPWRAQRRPLSPFLAPTHRVLLLRVLTRGMAWTEPSTTPRCQVGGDTPRQDVGGHAGVGGWVSWTPTSLSLCSRPRLQQRISPQLLRSRACSRPVCRPADSNCWFGQERKRVSPVGNQIGAGPSPHDQGQLAGGRGEPGRGRNRCLHPWVMRSVCP